MTRVRSLSLRLVRRLATAAALAAASVLTVSAARAEPSGGLEAVQEKLEKARKQERALDRKAAAAETSLTALRQRSIAIAARAQEHEQTILELEDRLEALEGRKRQTIASLDARRQQLSEMLAALQRIAMHPPVALIALPTDPVDTVRSALLLRSTVPPLVAQADILREDLAGLTELTQAVRKARERLQSERAALEEQRVALTRLTGQKAALVQTTRQAHGEALERAARLAREAGDLRDLMARLATQQAHRETALRLKPPADPPPPEEVHSTRKPQVASPRPPASSALPVRGRVARAFGAPTESGQPAKGITVEAGAGSTVVAPRDGVVVFAGPFRGLGQLLIIEYGGKYHLLLAGLARIDTTVGESVLAGEPVGIMQAPRGAGAALYMELRRNGQPINPLPWLAAGRTRVNG